MNSDSENYFAQYAEFLKSKISFTKPLKIVCDASNGTSGLVIKALQKLTIPNAEFFLINDTPDPEFPAHGPNPLLNNATDQAAKKVLEVGADFGAIFDADGDRAFFVDDKGELLPSFMTAALLFKNNQPPYVADETVYKSLQHIKLFPHEVLHSSKVGTFYVKHVLKESGASTAAEFSGHYYFKDFFNSDSGIFTMINVATIVSKLDSRLSDFIRTLPEQYVQSDDIKLGDKKWTDMEPKVHEFANQNNITVETREGITLDTGTTWVNMRASNTEPLVRLIGGGNNKQEIADFIAKIKSLV